MSAVPPIEWTRTVTRSVGCVCLWLLASASPARAEGPSKRAVLFGSSSMNDGFGHLLADDLSSAGYRVTRKGVAAAGFSRPDYRDVFEISRGVSIDAETDLVLVYLGMNDAQAFYLAPGERAAGEPARIPWKDQARWDAAYRARATRFVRGLCERGAKQVAVLLPVDVKSPTMQKRLDRIRVAQRAAAAEAPCATAIDTGGDFGKMGTGEGALRVHDGVHMSPKGARAVWNRIKARVLALTSS